MCSRGLRTRSERTAPPTRSRFWTTSHNVDVFGGTRISDQAWQAEFIVAVGASAIGTLRCVDTWLTDFRDDLPKLDVPVLVMQGSEDRILPPDSTGRRLPDLIDDVRYLEVDKGPHNIGWTHPEEVNAALLGFIATGEPEAVGEAAAVAA